MKQGKILGYRYNSALSIMETADKNIYTFLGWDKKQALIEFFKSKKNYQTHVIRKEAPRKKANFFEVRE